MDCRPGSLSVAERLDQVGFHVHSQPLDRYPLGTARSDALQDMM
jgi:hypothetical protein